MLKLEEEYLGNGKWRLLGAMAENHLGDTWGVRERSTELGRANEALPIRPSGLLGPWAALSTAL